MLSSRNIVLYLVPLHILISHTLSPHFIRIHSDSLENSIFVPTTVKQNLFCRWRQILIDISIKFELIIHQTLLKLYVEPFQIKLLEVPSDHDDMLSIIVQFYFQVLKHYVLLSNPTLNHGFIIFIRDPLCVSCYLFHQFCFNRLLVLDLNIATLDFVLQRLDVLKILHKLHPLLVLTILNFKLRKHFIRFFDLFVKCLLVAQFDSLYLFGTPIDIPRPVLHLETIEFLLSLKHFPLQVLVFHPEIQYLFVFLLLLVLVSRLLFQVFRVIFEEIVDINFFVGIRYVFLVAVVYFNLSVEG